MKKKLFYLLNVFLFLILIGKSVYADVVYISPGESLLYTNLALLLFIIPILFLIEISMFMLKIASGKEIKLNVMFYIMIIVNIILAILLILKSEIVFFVDLLLFSIIPLFVKEKSKEIATILIIINTIINYITLLLVLL